MSNDTFYFILLLFAYWLLPRMIFFILDSYEANKKEKEIREMSIDKIRKEEEILRKKFSAWYLEKIEKDKVK